MNNGNANANNGFRLANKNLWPEDRMCTHIYPVPFYLGALSIPAKDKHARNVALPNNATRHIFLNMEMVPITYYDDSIYDEFVTFENFYNGYLEARKGKIFRTEIMNTGKRVELIICEMMAEIDAGTWRPQKTYDFEARKETKRRIINAPTFRDRIFHHAFHRIIFPLVEKKFIFDSYANIPGKGQHKAVMRLQHFLRVAAGTGKKVYVLYCDIAHFYDTVDHRILMDIFGETFRGARIRSVVEALVEGYNEDTGKGIPKGSVTSGLFANMYLNEFDHFVKEDVAAKMYLRFVDDFIIVDTDKERLKDCKKEIEWFLDVRLNLRLNKKSQIKPISHGVDFVGYRVFTDHILPRKRTMKAAKIRFKTLSWLFANGEINMDDVTPRLMSFLGYCKHCKCKESLASTIRYLRLRRKQANENSTGED